MTAPTINRAQYRLESNVFEAVSHWLDTHSHRGYAAVIDAVTQLMLFFPDSSETFFEEFGVRANPEVVEFLKLVKGYTIEFS